MKLNENANPVRMERSKNVIMEDIFYFIFIIILIVIISLS